MLKVKVTRVKTQKEAFEGISTISREPIPIKLDIHVNGCQRKCAHGFGAKKSQVKVTRAKTRKQAFKDIKTVSCDPILIKLDIYVNNCQR